MATVNPWVKFANLLPQKTRYIITVTAVNGDGTVSGTLRDGSPVRVIGEGVAVNDRAWVEDGRVVGTAPNLPGFTQYV